MNIRRVLHYTGVDPQTGAYGFQDADGNGSINFPGDRLPLKEVGAKFYGGLQNTFCIKIFS